MFTLIFLLFLIVSWYKFQATFSFTPRQGHSLVGYQNKLYVIGGFSDGKCLNDTHCITLPNPFPFQGNTYYFNFSFFLLNIDLFCLFLSSLTLIGRTHTYSSL